MKFRSNRCNHAIDEAELGCIDRESETGYSEDTDQDNVGSTVVDDVEQTDGGGAEVGSRSGESGRGCSGSDAAVVARIGLMAEAVALRRLGAVTGSAACVGPIPGKDAQLSGSCCGWWQAAGALCFSLFLPSLARKYPQIFLFPSCLPSLARKYPHTK